MDLVLGWGGVWLGVVAGSMIRVEAKRGRVTTWEGRLLENRRVILALCDGVVTGVGPGP